MLLITGFLILGCEPNESTVQSSGDGFLDETAFVENAMSNVSDDLDDVDDNSSEGGFGGGKGPRGFLPGAGFGLADCATVEETEEGVYPQIIHH